MKTCKKCQLEYTIKQCPACQKLYMKKYREDNKQCISEIVKTYYNNNKIEILQYHQTYSRINKNKIRQYQNKYEKEKRSNDPAFKLRKNCSSLIRIILKGNKSKSSILEHLPYTMSELKQHLEKQFDDKMTWENYGKYWHIDHIIPQSSFTFTSMSDESFKKCWDLNNLRPLEAIENIRKSNKVSNVPK